jgi:hypothetical protein
MSGRVHSSSDLRHPFPPLRLTGHGGVGPAWTPDPSDQVLRLHSFVIGLIHDYGHPEGAPGGAIAARTQSHAGHDTEEILSYDCFPQN